PNPFQVKTEIRYFLPQEVQQAYLCIFDMQGKMLKKLDAPAGENTLTIRGSELHAGMYLYSLIADGKEVDTKRMILTK
ncbi:MAG: T9SS type A sorting domain-containing protein, partial [Prevotella sp.]|nr:T9SS type A sorting domain-containing protein [Prevotella sp.]